MKVLISLLFLVWTVGLFAAEEQSGQDRPVVIWVSSPVLPGETVLVHGGNWGEKPVVELTIGRKKLTVAPISVSDASLMFVYPESWKPAVIGGVVKSGELVSELFKVNAPDIWWIHGDRGREASTSLGSISLFGNCLSDHEKSDPEVRLNKVDESKKGRTISLKVARYNRFSIHTENWKEIPEGLYEVTLVSSKNSEPVSAGKISISEKKSIFPKEVFDVVQFGAIPNDGIDDTTAILAAVEKLKENGGGELLFPRGRYQMTRTIELPPYAILRGLGRDCSQVYWPDSYEPLEALIKGTHSFEVSDIFLTCGNHKDGIAGNWPEPRQPLTAEEKAVYKCGNISIRNVTLRMLYSQYINSDMDELKRRLQPIHYARALRLGGENINVTGNDIYCAAGGVFEFRAYWSRISGNTFSRGNIVGWNGYSGQQLIFADNHLGGANCTSYYGLPEGSENIYWGNNYHENNFDGNNRETITGDGRVHTYMDTVENITPTSFTMKGEVKWSRGIDTWKQGAVQVAGGRGVGQLRRIKSIDGSKIELESAWDIIPDETSVINISSFRRRFIYTENKAYDSTVALQLYGSMIEGIIADNETSRTGGYNGDAMAGEANWFNQFFDNTIESGNSYRGPRNEVPALDAQLGLLAYGTGTGDYKYPLVRSCVVRNNELKCDAKLNVMGWVVDSLLEKNRVANSNVGVTISDAARNIVLRNNVFDGVYKPYEYNQQSVVIRPVEELWSAMNGAAVLMGWHADKDMPADWHEINTNEELADATQEGVAAAWERAVKAFAEQNGGKPISDKLAETLMGIQVQTPNWQTAYSTIRDGRAGTSSLLLRIPNSRIKAHLKLSVRQEDFPFEGWSFVIPELDLEPGKSADFNATITKPEGRARMLRIPLCGELSGDDWKLTFTTTTSDPWDTITLDKFKVSQPFDNPLGRQVRLGYIKYEQIPMAVKDQLVDAVTEFGRFAFASSYADPANEGKIIYGITTLKAKGPVTVRFQFGGNCLVFVNGKVVGTTLGRGQWGFVRLEEGENKVETLMLPAKRDEWRFGLPKITWAEKAMVIE